MRVLAAVIVTVLVWVSVSFPYESSTSVYPSEDELDEALRLGEIDYSQYLILQEIIVHGIDSASKYLFDEIPNLSFFLSSPRSLLSSLEKEQAAGFIGAATITARPRGILGYQYYQKLEPEGQARYRTSGNFRPTNQIVVAFKLNREYSGSERFVSRRLVYKNPRGRLREFALGNFSHRLGLGTIFGYRGKLFEFSSHLDEESLLFPDYGGYNGFYSRVKFEDVETEMLASVNRDNKYTLVSAGGMVSLAKSRFRPGLIIGVNSLKNRNTGKHLEDIKYGLSLRYRYSESYLSFEASAQNGERRSWGCAVAEGRHLFGRAEIRYAGWVYADTYVDLTGGSKAGNLYHADTLRKVDFPYLEKRSGQQGGMIKSIVLLMPDIEMVSSILFAGRNGDTAEVQFLSGLVKEWGQSSEVRLDYLNRTKKRTQPESDQRTRLEARIRTGKLSARSYIAYNTKSNRSDNISVFVNLKYQSWKVGSFEIWSNLARFDLKDNGIDYWYAYIKSEQRLFSGVTVGMKLSYSYDRQRSKRHRTVVLLEMRTAV